MNRSSKWRSFENGCAQGLDLTRLGVRDRPLQDQLWVHGADQVALLSHCNPEREIKFSILSFQFYLFFDITKALREFLNYYLL